MRRSASQLWCTRVMKARAVVWSSAAISVMSAPPMKARSPAPRSTTARRSGRCASASASATRPAMRPLCSVFSLAALSIVRVATPRGSILAETRMLPPIIGRSAVIAGLHCPVRLAGTQPVAISHAAPQQETFPMPLTPPAPREELHTRAITLRGYRRQDGLFDIEARLVDTKPFAMPNQDRGHIRAGEPLHEMWMRLTIDETMQIVACEAATDHG